MAISLPLETMSVEEKIQAMESLWDDLRDRAENIASPAWHGEVLADREAGLEHGTEHFADWNSVKKNIKNRTA